MKLKHLIPILLLALCILAAPVAAAGGAGTASNPYVIQTPAELQSVQNDLSAYYILGNDIDMSGYSFVPIGSTSAPFFGSLDGRGYAISNMAINLPDDSNVGLFRVISSGAHISNIKFVDCTILGGSDVALFGICIGVSGTAAEIVIENIDAVGCTVSGKTFVGGITAANENLATTTIRDCDVENCVIEATGGSYAGGIVARLSNGGSGSLYSQGTVQGCTVSNCYVMSSSGTMVGGIVGLMSNGGSFGYVNDCSVEDCVIEADRYSVGGIAGSLSNGGSGSLYSQGMVQGCTVSNCVTIGSYNVGGIVGLMAYDSSFGYVNDCNVEDCTVRANSYAGGIAGCKYAADFGDISGCSVTNTTVQADSYAGGICPTFTR